MQPSPAIERSMSRSIYDGHGRFFSKMGMLISERRRSLCSNKVCMISMIAGNIDHVMFRIDSVVMDQNVY